VISGAAGAPQSSTSQYGYHRVTVNGTETRVEFVEVNQGQLFPVDSAGSHQAACPKIDNTDGG